MSKDIKNFLSFVINTSTPNRSIKVAGKEVVIGDWNSAAFSQENEAKLPAEFVNAFEAAVVAAGTAEGASADASFFVKDGTASRIRIYKTLSVTDLTDEKAGRLIHLDSILTETVADYAEIDFAEATDFFIQVIEACADAPKTPAAEQGANEEATAEAEQAIMEAATETAAEKNLPAPTSAEEAAQMVVADGQTTQVFIQILESNHRRSASTNAGLAAALDSISAVLKSNAAEDEKISRMLESLRTPAETEA